MTHMRTLTRAYFFLSCSSLSQFIELSHLQVEAFNLDSGVTQPQLSLTAAAVRELAGFHMRTRPLTYF